MNNLKHASSIFYMKDSECSEILRLNPNGDIFVKGKLIENDKEVTNAMREFLKSQGFLNENKLKK